MSLERLLNPKSVAFIGGERAGFAIEQSRTAGFDGEMWAVNPTRPELAGVATVASVDRLPAPPDAAFVAVDRERSIDVVGALAVLGAGGAVCYASGFAESGPEGEDLQRRLIQVAADMPIIGPNCHGFVNARSGAVLWPDVQGCRRVDAGAAIVTQSGNLAINMTMHRRGLALSHVVTLGNQAGVGIEDCFEFFVSDPAVTAIGLHIEALSDPVRFGRIALAAHESGRPVVVLKTGLSAEGASIARTHTASLAGSAPAHQALFDRYGIASVSTVPEFLSALAVLGRYGRLAGNRLTSLSCSGGEAGLVADRAAGRNVVFPPFEPSAADRIAATLSHRVPVTNPLDYHTFIWGDLPVMTECFTQTLSAGVDAGMLVIDFPKGDDTWWWPTMEAFVAAHRASGVPAIVTSSLPENLPEHVALWLDERGIPTVPGIDDALAALEVASSVPEPSAVIHAPAPVPPARVTTLGEHQTKEMLRAAGVRVPEGRIVPTSGLVAGAEELGYPVVLKSVGLEHKTESGGVVVGIGDQDDLERAATSMGHLGTHFLVEQFFGGAVAELVVGVRREHPVGWTVTVGTGGVLVELLADSVTLLAPVTGAEVRQALESLRIAPLITGHRGRAGGDVDSAVRAVCAIVDAALADPGVIELEVNPLLVLGDGAVAVDALAVIED